MIVNITMTIHEPSIQALFSKNVMSMVDMFEQSGNPFSEDSQDLVVLDTKAVISYKSLSFLDN